MANFIRFEAEVDAESHLSDNDDEIDENANNFIVSNDNVTESSSRSFYRQFMNVENDLDSVLFDARNEALRDIEEFDEIRNLDENNMEMDIDDFESSQSFIAKFEKTSQPETDNQICNVIIKALKHKNINSNIIHEIVPQINQPKKYKFVIDHQYFFNMCYKLTSILSKFGYFLRVYELKKKYRHLFVKKPD